MGLTRHHCDRFPVCFLPDKEQPLAELKPEPEALPAAESDPKPKMPAALDVKKTITPTLTVPEEVPFRPSISLDTIVNQEIHSLTSDIKNLMHTQHISYSSQLPPRLPLRHCWQLNRRFSNYVVPYVAPVSVHGHVEELRAKMDKLIPAPPAPSKNASPPPPEAAYSLTTPPPAATQTSKTKADPSVSTESVRTGSDNKETTPTEAKTEAVELGGEIYSPSHTTADSPNAQNAGTAPGGGSNLLAGSLISQLKPEVFTSLVEIFKDVTKNTVKFYIYSGDEGEESTVCKEIKVKYKTYRLHVSLGELFLKPF